MLLFRKHSTIIVKITKLERRYLIIVKKKEQWIVVIAVVVMIILVVFSGVLALLKLQLQTPN